MALSFRENLVGRTIAGHNFFLRPARLLSSGPGSGGVLPPRYGSVLLLYFRGTAAAGKAPAFPRLSMNLNKARWGREG
ncbi:hypothetical protein, partial [uncultured Desulfovibrio sp.]|uniref:hypothetical protein n=1 Tax=uncultured Desulfovibrio sp. TaxID=167968 RepID=UPI0026382E4D